MNIAIGIPTPDLVNPNFAIVNLQGIISYTRSNFAALDKLVVVTQGGVRTDRNRNIILEQVIAAGDFDYILWLDADMLYPHDIICKYLEKDFDVMGCLYFKRTTPYAPVAYIKGENPLRPFRPIDPLQLPINTVVQVDGLGYGGTMVSMKVYEGLGEKKWTRYGSNFHLPFDSEDHLTHDLVFCQDAQAAGFQIMLHTGVKPGHIAEYVVTQEDWQRARNEQIPEVAVIMPTIRPEQAEKTAKILEERAGLPIKIIPQIDAQKIGYAKICNEYVKNNKASYYVFVSDDVFPSRNWLINALQLIKDKKGGLVGFNDGKWGGSIATSGLISREWMLKNYNGDLFFPEYFGHYNDVELTILAMSDHMYCYDSGISLIEVDYEKDNKTVYLPDKKLFAVRKSGGFDNRVLDQDLLKDYA